MFYFKTCTFFPPWWIGWIREACLQFTWKHGNFAVVKHEGKNKIAPQALTKLLIQNRHHHHLDCVAWACKNTGLIRKVMSFSFYLLLMTTALVSTWSFRAFLKSYWKWKLKNCCKQPSCYLRELMWEVRLMTSRMGMSQLAGAKRRTRQDCINILRRSYTSVYSFSFRFKS